MLGFNARFKDDPRVMAWMHGDEPDNASPDSTRSMRDFRAWRTADPTRPVYVNLGQGVANERFGVLTPENYRAYCQAADIISFDVYPVTNIGRIMGGLIIIVQLSRILLQKAMHPSPDLSRSLLVNVMKELIDRPQHVIAAAPEVVDGSFN